MSEMIERVAAKLFDDEDNVVRWVDMVKIDEPEAQHLVAIYRRRSRAAIEEMRDPTMAMELAAQASDQRPSTIWGTMVNEALK